MDAVLVVAAKSTVILLVAFAVATLARRARASVRHAIFAAAFVALLLLPLASALAPEIELPVLDAAPVRATDAHSPAPASVQPAIITAAVAQLPATRWSLAAVAIAVYASGVASILLMLVAGMWRLRGWASDAEVWREATVEGARVLLSDRIQSPLTFGFLEPTILMPAAARNWSADEVNRALKHELEHVRRGDWKLQLLARVACAVYWPHPLVWTAWRRFSLEAERACDDAVLSGSEASLYAQQLVTLARDLVRRPRVPAMAMASRSQLARRIDAILDPARSRGPAGKASRLLAAVVALMVVLGIGPVRLVAAAAESGLMDAVTDGVADGVSGGTAGGVNEGVPGGVSGALAEIETYADVFVEAAEDGDVDRLDRLFSATRIDFDTPFVGDGTVLLIAARRGQLDAVRWLLDRGADPNAPSLGDGNPLIAAADRNQLEAMQLLLERGARVDDVVPGDENALITASAAGHEQAVRLLIRHGANVNARVWADAREWRTPLNMARRGRHRDVERILLAAGATN
ncbi:MAG TPA: M56 family metallopeptidase [Thermoanaerobaculia bacterium]|jgi:beta-lactamase regulating signal transducer with metallopeptidase domain